MMGNMIVIRFPIESKSQLFIIPLVESVFFVYRRRKTNFYLYKGSTPMILESKPRKVNNIKVYHGMSAQHP